MTYCVRPVSRDLLPEGHDWLFLREHGGGDIHFVLADDVDCLELSCEALEVIVGDVAEHAQLPIRVAS